MLADKLTHRDSRVNSITRPHTRIIILHSCFSLILEFYIESVFIRTQKLACEKSGRIIYFGVQTTSLWGWRTRIYRYLSLLYKSNAAYNWGRSTKLSVGIMLQDKKQKEMVLISFVLVLRHNSVTHIVWSSRGLSCSVECIWPVDTRFFLSTYVNIGLDLRSHSLDWDCYRFFTVWNHVRSHLVPKPVLCCKLHPKI